MYDAVIVGGGPAGLSAALVLGRCRRRLAVFDDEQPRNAAARAVHGYLGHEGVAPYELRRLGRDELAAYGAEFHAEKIAAAERTQRDEESGLTLFRLQTAGGRELFCRKLLLATGVVDDLPEIAGLRECYGISVHHCPYCDGWEHRDQRLLAIGRNAEAAAGLALMLCQWSSQVTVVTGGETLSSQKQAEVAGGGIAICHQDLIRLVHEKGHLFGAELGGGNRVPCDALFFNTRQRPRSPLAEMLGCQWEDDAHVHSKGKQKSDRQGLFLAGDVDGDTQLAIIAAAEGATAAVAIHQELLREDRAGIHAG